MDWKDKDNREGISDPGWNIPTIIYLLYL
jgi:hypothetical protein